MTNNHIFSITMHPTEKTLRVYKEDNELLRIKNDQLTEKAKTLQQQISTLLTENRTLNRQCKELAELYQKELHKDKAPITRSVHLTQERVQLFMDVEEFINNYSGMRPRLSELTPTIPESYFSPSKGSYIPATLLLNEFIDKYKYDIPPTYRIFCRQLNLLGLHKIRCRQYGTHPDRKRPPSYSRTLKPSQQMAKIYMYFIPHSTTQS